MGDLGNKILEKIRKEKIEPKPRWHFLLQDYFVWLAFGVSLVVGGLTFCVALSIMVDNDWDIFRYLSVSPIKHVLLSLPYVWIILIILFLGLALYNYKHTKNGYKHETFYVLGLSVVGSLILGSFFHLLGAGRKIDRIFANNLPIYQKIHCCCHRKDIWSQPEKGLLSGEILKAFGSDGFELEDFGGFVWQVEKDEKVLMPVGFLIVAGRKVKLIGEKRTEKLFRAREIRFWEE